MSVKPKPSDYPVHGVDVSGFQAPAQQPVAAYFVIVRATFGTRPDQRAVEHVARAREAGKTVGLYHFYVPGQASERQADVFGAVAAEVGLGRGDLIPWIDIESPKADGSMQPRPSWSEPLAELAAELVANHGGVGLYLSADDWRDLGSPEWVPAVPLWGPHSRTRAGSPASPGGARPAIWQYRVGTWSPGALHVLGQHARPDAIDHDCALGPLPLIGTEPDELTEPDVAPVCTPDLSLDSDYWQEHRAARDAMVRERGT